MTDKSNTAGILAMVMSCCVFVVGDTSMKFVMGDGVPPMQVLAIRGVIGCLICLAMIVALGSFGAISHAVNRWVMLRALGETLAVVCFVQALKRMPQADLTAIFQISPLLVVLGAALLFGERIGPARAVLLALGFAGAVMVARPGAAAAHAAAPLGFLGAILVAGRDLAARRTPPEVPTLVATLTTLVMVTVLAVVSSALFEEPVLPSGLSLGLLVMAGVLVLLGNAFAIYALRFAELGVLAPFYYTFTLVAVLAGYLVFGEVPNALALAGIVLIVASGVAVVLLGDGRRQSAGPVQ
jgi:drug/metabolite transporter (DMT)-like permease